MEYAIGVAVGAAIALFFVVFAAIARAGLNRRAFRNAKGEDETDRTLFFPPEVFREFQRLVKTLTREDRIFISDRKLVKLYKLFRVRSWLFSGGTVSRDDLRLLAYLGESHQEIEHLREKVPQLLGDA